MKGPRSGFPSTLLARPAEVVGGRYRLGTRIGQGGVADVHEGVDLRLGRQVAVKVFRPGSDPHMEERFSEEAVLLARMQHPSLVTVYDVGRHRDLDYLVMQLVKGPTLRRCLSAGPLRPGRVAELGAALGRALAHVHAAGVVHRDVKPSNVLLNSSGHPHLTDFGIARLADSTRHTASDVLIGTAAYLSPEQVMGEAVGSPADVYALGLVLLECLKGELEYDGTPLEAAVARMHRPPLVPDWVPDDLACLLHLMTATDAAARPDAEHCAEALSTLATPSDGTATSSFTAADMGAPLQEPAAAPPARPRRTRRGAQVRRLAVGTALTALSAAALGAGFTTLSDSPPNSGERAAPTSPLTRQPSEGTPRAPRPAGPASPSATPSSAPSAAAAADPVEQTSLEDQAGSGAGASGHGPGKHRAREATAPAHQPKAHGRAHAKPKGRG
ncbi:serine/threonine-protein kinase [Streptomyces sp. NPDC086766]|uniref:serine/threonine-protein kinase n=1 Tax=Streptomyces sp. NPDC086766 TaxID=3365754 RepID=UPI00382818A3